MARILYVDDERPLGRAVHAWLSRKGVEVRRAHSVAGARRCLTKYRFDGAFVDVWLGDGTGFELYEHLRERYPELAGRVAFVTGDTVPRADVRRRLKALGLPVITKPFDLADLETWIEVWTAQASRTTAAHDAGRAKRAKPHDDDAPHPKP